jgi:hypothetical protein
MHIRMSNLERLTLAEMAEFVASNQGVDWQARTSRPYTVYRMGAEEPAIQPAAR